MTKHSLYQCFNAKVKGNIYCSKGHPLGRIPIINIERLARGDALELSSCQNCPDYDEMGPPVAPQDRGWVINTTHRGRPRKEQGQ